MDRRVAFVTVSAEEAERLIAAENRSPDLSALSASPDDWDDDAFERAFDSLCDMLEG